MKRFLPYTVFLLFILFILSLMSLFKYGKEQGRKDLEIEIITAIERNDTSVIGPFVIVKNVSRDSEVWTNNQKYYYNKIEYHK